MVLFVSSGCAPGPDEDGFIPWEQVVGLIHDCRVETAVQTHDREVTLKLDSGVEVRSIEPEIDQVFRELEACGECCLDVVLVTE